MFVASSIHCFSTQSIKAMALFSRQIDNKTFRDNRIDLRCIRREAVE